MDIQNLNFIFFFFIKTLYNSKFRIKIINAKIIRHKIVYPKLIPKINKKNLKFDMIQI